MGATSALDRWANRVSLKADPRQQDTTAPAGTGISTAQLSNPNAADIASVRGPGTIVAPDAHNAPWAQPVPIWFGLIGLLLLAKYGAERSSEKSEFSSIRIGFWNTLVITTTAVVGLNFGKWIFSYWKVPGISALVLAA